jgi:hypothetical protein
MRLGILFGFLIGAAVASLLASSEAEETGTGVVMPDGGLMVKLKRQTAEARKAAREASEQKQAEMLRDWEQARSPDAQP